MNWDSEMDECKSKIHLCPNLNGIWEFFWNSFLFSFGYYFNEFV